ncbi:Uncharacterised protein [Acinetobacter phage MD-2021a]|nr:Uncharacterised protein [Acinetobacter phage MD-2021a]CAH1088905.1 Uncharacterised protein [Acinetobacter phage MD-2021a]
MIINFTEDLIFDSECYLYWIRKKSHNDVFTDGYVGITRFPRRRLSSHNRCLGSYEKAVTQGYSSDFINDFNSEDLVFEIINCGSLYEIQEQEYLLRPRENIGYNVAVGGVINGVCSRYSHGGSTDYSMYLRYKRILDYCISNDIYVDFNFKNEHGYKLFLLHCLKINEFNDVKFKNVRLLDETKGFVVGNFELSYMYENQDCSKWVYFDNKWWSKKEACLHNGVDIGTANKRLSIYNATRLQAVGFEKMQDRGFEIINLDGYQFRYDLKNSKFTKDDLVDMYKFYKTGERGFKSFCKNKGVSSSNMIRYFKRYGVVRNVKESGVDYE